MNRAFTLLALCLMVVAGPAGAATPLPVRMLVPGFTVRELPVELTNLNNLEYAPDGRLFAVGYDGRIHALTDTNGDGLEDASKEFYAPKATDLRAPVGMAIAPEGIYVASKGRISLLRDKDNDGVADSCEMVVGGWPELFVAVDSLGVAIDKDNNLYYGRGCHDFTNPLQIDKRTGKAGYSLKQETGTIMKVSPDRKRREIVATGIRFSVGLQFNRHGDLFATDQEGATWVPGENTLDELLHIVPGRHYGFPARHEKHLPNVFNEPSVVEFGPQHQSACGFRFNEAVAGRKPIGPEFWLDNALVTGESRGKIWRCPLVKTPSGYVGKPVLIAALDMLTIDLCLSPNGDMLVCCHSGPPDWGTGPKGKGRIFKISYTDKSAPQPVIAYPVSRTQVHVLFDKPVDSYVLSTPKELKCGQYVSAADRLESMRPPYKVLEEQATAPVTFVRVLEQKLADEGRTLVLRTEPLPWQATYALAIPGVRAAGAIGTGHTVDVEFTPNGVRFAEGDGRSVGYLPHLDLAVNEAWLAGSHRKASLGDAKLSLSTVLRLPGKKNVLRLRSNRPFALTAGRQHATSGEWQGTHRVMLPLDAAAAGVPLNMVVEGVAGTPLSFHAAYTSDDDPTERPVRAEHLALWHDLPAPPAPLPAATQPAVAGDWHRGKALFHGEAKCSTCHGFTSENTTLGPNLGNLVHRERAAILRDIVNPSAMINPDYLGYKVRLKGGEVVAGLVVSDGADRLRVIESPEKSVTVSRADVMSLSPEAISIMPEGFADLGEAKLNDLLTFLTTPEPKK